MILSKFEWLPDAYPEVADLFFYMARISLSAVLHEPEPDEDAPSSSSASPSKKAILAEKNVPLISHRLIPSTSPDQTAPIVVAKKRLLVPHAPLPTANAWTEFVYFYPAWSDTIPLCTTREEIASVVGDGLLRFTGKGGANCARDVGLMTMLTRIGIAEVQKVSKCRSISYYLGLTTHIRTLM